MIRSDGNPTTTAGQVFVAVKETGVKSQGRTFLREIYQFEISVWRRASSVPADVSGQLQLSSDPWIPNMFALDQLEREIVRSIHGNHADLPQSLNDSLSLGIDPNGDRYLLPLYYEGRSGTETLPKQQSKQPVWYGRRLQFSGMTRVQALDVIR